MQYSVNIDAIAKEVFGYKVLPYRMPRPQQKDQQGNEQLEGGTYESEGTGLFGLPVFTSVQLQVPGGSSVTLLDVIVTVDLARDIVITPVQGKSGTVKEYIANGDYAVTIQGILASDPNSETRFQYPATQVEQLEDVAKAPIALVVNSRRLSVHGIKNLVVRDIKWPAAPGFVNTQPFELQCLSDEPYELQLK